MIKVFFLLHCGHSFDLFLGRSFAVTLLPSLLLSFKYPVLVLTTITPLCKSHVELAVTAAGEQEFFTATREVCYACSYVIILRFLFSEQQALIVNSFSSTLPRPFCVIEIRSRECLHELSFAFLILLHAKIGPRNI